MRPRLPILALLLVFAASAHAQLSADIAFPNLTFSSPVGIEHDPTAANRLYVVEQRGTIRVFANDPEVASAGMFLDIQARVNDGPDEAGLLGLAFHPDYETNGFFYVSYTAGSPLRSRIARFSRSELNPVEADPDSEVILLEVNQPFGNHNGGGLAFGSDGYLYASFGDGGSGGDPLEHGQNSATLLGTILRLDVDGGGAPPDCGGPDANYTVPDNALADGPGGACDEIYAWGLRNPWRFSFDRETGEGWIADVGQNRWEEIDVMQNGGNYGWNTYEGNECFDPPCSPEGFVFPVWVYSSATGSPHCSVTGGYVYRGDSVPELAGRYVYGDYCSGQLWALDVSGSAPQNEQLPVGTFPSLTSFGEDDAGELYFVQRNGRVYRFFSEADTSGEGGAPRGEPSLRLAGPNPFRSQTALRFRLAEAGPVRVAVYDVLGREVALLHDGPAPAEAQMVRLAAGALPAGVYVVRLVAAGGSVSQRLTLLR